MLKNIVCLMICYVLFISMQMTHAAEPKLTKNFQTCLDKSGGVTTNMLDCIGIELKYQDARLNKAYKSLMSTLNANRKKELQEVQRTWIEYRDANCKFYYDPDGGSIVRIASANCTLEETAARAKELENLKAPYN